MRTDPDEEQAGVDPPSAPVPVRTSWVPPPAGLERRPGRGIDQQQAGHQQVDRQQARELGGREHPWRNALRGRRQALRANPRRNHLYRVAVAAVGTLVVVVGLALVPLPGPGWLVVFLGLAVLGSEFHSARRLNAFGQRQLHRWLGWVERRSWRTRIVLGGATGALVVAAVWGWFAWQGVPTWTPEVVTAQLQRVPGLG